MGIGEALAKLYPSVFGNPYIMFIPLIGIAGVVLYIFMKDMNKVKMELFYFSPIERLINPLKVSEVTPRSIITKDNKRFMRRATSWLFKRGSSSVVVWLGKVGRGITFSLESTPKKKAERVGTLLEGCESCLGDNVSKIPKAQRDLLSESNIFVCLELEPTTDDMPNITEEGATTEADNNVGNLIGMKIKEHLQKEDWIRDAGLIGIGVATLFIAQALGVL